MATTAPRLDQAVGFIKTHQNPDGGWGYEPRRASLVEPSAFSVLALHARGDSPEAGRGLAYLKSNQKDSGAVGTGPLDPEGSWMAYAALLAFHALGAGPEEQRLKAWILGFEDASDRFTKEEIASIAARFRYDASIRGWPWTPRTTAWVEPTALFILGLRHAGVPATEKRIRSGVDLIIDRRVPSGGWNFGNPFSSSFELEASTMSTALALSALGAAGVPESRPEARAGIRYIARAMNGDISTASLAWLLLAAKSFPSGAPFLAGLTARLARLQRSDGSFRGNLFETALACLVLGDAPILRPLRPGDP
ncbi:MAG: terpene cyclase/mutase family protein [Candidatus Aminicenantes bacterium]|nr:terpene cyclase/mutase family protein [Candidatus Aminicenantes bacterium]